MSKYLNVTVKDKPFLSGKDFHWENPGSRSVVNSRVIGDARKCD